MYQLTALQKCLINHLESVKDTTVTRNYAEPDPDHDALSIPE